MKPLYIFDLGGTLALIEHRLPFIQGPKKDWRGFFAACKDDAPNLPVIRTLQALRKSGAEVWIWSGRSDECRDATLKWLHTNGCIGWDRMFMSWVFSAPEAFRMRKAGDYRDDVVIKREWLSEIEPPEWSRLTAVFDDRGRVVQMWRDAGVPCFQVAPGEF